MDNNIIALPKELRQIILNYYFDRYKFYSCRIWCETQNQLVHMTVMSIDYPPISKCPYDSSHVVNKFMIEFIYPAKSFLQHNK